MLPSFRLIAATFFCGFIAVFAGLRLAVSLNDINAALPLTAAHAAPVAVPAERSQPVMYDMRFAVSSIAKGPAPLNVTALVIDRTAPLAVSMPLPIVPAEEFSATPAPANLPTPDGPEADREAIPAPDADEATPQ